ncbi:DUF4259 domain-containing protein [Xanthomonas sp. SI]|uniref:DUF4259 domain-containing protein n=1 Tax=Xanthomonas sp. SI TaxID=2724123 RepID=UPI00163B41AA|nr:DUF4259 domain-containing protein [Xanthomonas sp. SI]QNH11215.1 hypothetical protein HEP75_00634 [Xanthomonas sp. SI]
MGAWSHESFGNDTACDWSGPLADAVDLAYVDETLQRVLDAGDDEDLDMAASCEAIAAAEVVARLQGHFGVCDAYSRTVDDWVKKTRLVPSAALASKARAALDRIVSVPSELRELWEESEDAEAWLFAVSALRDRIFTRDCP